MLGDQWVRSIRVSYSSHIKYMNITENLICILFSPKECVEKVKIYCVGLEYGVNKNFQ